MKQSTHIKIPTRLHTQLKSLASARGTTMTAVLHETVRKAIEAGEIADETPGFHIVADLDNKRVVFDTDEGTLASMTSEQAEGVADTIVQVVTKTTAGGASEPLGDEHSLSIRYVGTGIVFHRVESLSEVTLRSVTTPAQALDIAKTLKASAELVASFS